MKGKSVGKGGGNRTGQDFWKSGEIGVLDLSGVTGQSFVKRDGNLGSVSQRDFGAKGNIDMEDAVWASYREPKFVPKSHSKNLEYMNKKLSQIKKIYRKNDRSHLERTKDKFNMTIGNMGNFENNFDPAKIQPREIQTSH